MPDALSREMSRLRQRALAPSPLGQRPAYLDGQQAVFYRSRMNPFLGRNFEAMDPREWLARMADQISDPGKHRT